MFVVIVIVIVVVGGVVCNYLTRPIRPIRPMMHPHDCVNFH